VDTGRVVLSGWHDRTALPPGLRAAAKVVTHRLVVCVTALPRPAPGVGLPVRVAAGLPLGRRWSVTQWSDQRPAGGSGPRVAGAAEGGAPLQTASEGQRLLLPYALSAAPSHRLEIVVSVPPPPPPPPPPPGLPPPNEDPPAAAVEEPGRGPAVYDVVADRWEAIPARSGSDGRARWATTAVARYVTADRVIRLRDCGHRAWLTVTQIVGLRL
jgi:hypothetical protein